MLLLSSKVRCCKKIQVMSTKFSHLSQVVQQCISEHGILDVSQCTHVCEHAIARVLNIFLTMVDSVVKEKGMQYFECPTYSGYTYYCSRNNVWCRICQMRSHFVLDVLLFSLRETTATSFEPSSATWTWYTYGQLLLGWNRSVYIVTSIVASLQEWNSLRILFLLLLLYRVSISPFAKQVRTWNAGCYILALRLAKQWIGKL